MDKQAFERYLKRKGKKNHVIERNIAVIQDFQKFLSAKHGMPGETATLSDIDAYVTEIEKAGQSAKGYLYVLMNYFACFENEPLRHHAATLREARTRKSRRVYPIREFMDVDPETVRKLEQHGIRTVDDMLAAAATKEQRDTLARRLNVAYERILELVQLADITRLGYVKKKLSRLFHNAGLRSPEAIAAFEPEALHTYLKAFVQRSKWSGMVPNPADLVGNVRSARRLKPVVEPEETETQSMNGKD